MLSVYNFWSVVLPPLSKLRSLKWQCRLSLEAHFYGHLHIAVKQCLILSTYHSTVKEFTFFLSILLIRQSQALLVWLLKEWIWISGQWSRYLHDIGRSWKCRGESFEIDKICYFKFEGSLRFFYSVKISVHRKGRIC